MLQRLLRDLFARGTPPELPKDEAGCDSLIEEMWRRGEKSLALSVYDCAVASGLSPCERRFDAAYRRALVATRNRPSPLRRRQRFHQLYLMLGSVLHLDGDIAECGCFRGLSSHLMLGRIRLAEAGFEGRGYHIFDSFEGLSAPTGEDAIAESDPDRERLRMMCKPGGFAASLDTVRQGLAEFPAVEFHPGWIPQSFAGQPDRRYRFVHLDLDLHEPTLAALEYFHSRLVPGAIVVSDDYNWPGARKAIQTYSARRGIPFEVTPQGQVMLRYSVSR
jgi:O-methyltransferase